MHMFLTDTKAYFLLFLQEDELLLNSPSFSRSEFKEMSSKCH